MSKLLPIELTSEDSFLTSKLEQLKKKIIRPPSDILKHTYLVPGGPYEQAWDWDTFFIGVALTYNNGGELLRDSLLNFIDLIQEDGHAPWVITSTESGLQKPQQCKPFLCQGAFIASKSLKDFNWLNPYYTRLKATLKYWEVNRRAPNGLFKWWDGLESGVDNNPAVLEFAENTVEGVDLNSYLYREYKALALIAKRLGYQEDANLYRNKAEKLKELIEELMWDTEDKMYYNIDSTNNQRIKVKTWTNFVPLWAAVASKEHAKATIETHLLSKDEFWSEFGIRSLSKDDPRYNQANIIKPFSNAQGPIWVITNYLVMHGLINYDFRTEALELANKIQELLKNDIKHTNGMHECYNAETGEPLAAPNFIGWNLLAETMSLEAKLGFDPSAVDESLFAFNPVPIHGILRTNLQAQVYISGYLFEISMNSHIGLKIKMKDEYFVLDKRTKNL